MKKQTTAQLRKSNHNLVRNVMLTEEAWTKEALAAATGLSRSTCYNILMDMLAAGEAAELSHGASDGGRPASRFQYRRTSVLFALVLLQCENLQKSVSILVTDIGGTVLSRQKRQMDSVSVEFLGELLQETVKVDPRIKAVGISYPGAVRNGRTACWSDMEELTDLDLQTLLRQRLDLPLYIENDVEFIDIEIYATMLMDPYLLRKGKAEISLKNSAKGVVRIRALDVNGAVLAEIPFRESKGSVIFTADTDQYGAMAYELLRIP